MTTPKKEPPKWRPVRKARVMRGKDQFMRWLLALLERGMFPRSIRFERGAGRFGQTIEAGEGAPEEVPPEVVKRSAPKRGRKRSDKKRGESRDEQVKRLARERMARYRARKRQTKETNR